MPETFGALRKSKLFGTASVQNKTDFVKYRLFATVVTAEEESSVYNPVVLEYAGKAVALQLIPAGLDYWGSQEKAITTKGTEEDIEFFDRVEMLLELQKRLWAEMEELLPIVERDINITPSTKARPRVGPTGEDKTTDPQKFPAEFNEEEALFPGEITSWQ